MQNPRGRSKEQEQKQDSRGLRPVAFGIGRVLRSTASRFLSDRVPSWAAAISYYAVFSLAPLLVLLFAALGLVLDPNPVRVRILDEIREMIGAGAAAQIQDLIQLAEQSRDESGTAAVLGGIALLVGATGALFQLQAALNSVWGVRPDPERSQIRVQLIKRTLSLAMILVIGFLLTISMALSAGVSWAASVLADRLPTWLAIDFLVIGQAVTALLTATLLFAAMFRVLTDARLRARDLWIGSAATALLFQGGQWGLAIYISTADPGSLFGTAGSLALVLIWIYYSANVFLLGAEFTRAWAEEFGPGIRPAANAVLARAPQMSHP